MKINLTQLDVYRARRKAIREFKLRSYIANSEGMERINYGATDLAWQVMVNELVRKERSKGRRTCS